MTSVRPAASVDEAALFGLATQFPAPNPCDREAFREIFRSKLLDPQSAVIVAEQDGRLVGYVSGYAHRAFYAGGPTAWVDEILVVPPLRNAGVGRLLISAFEAWAARGGCVLVGLATRGASPFYERLGYASGAGYFKKYLQRRVTDPS